MNVLDYLKKEEIVELGCDLIRQPSLTRQEGPAVKFAKDWFEDNSFDEVTLQEVKVTEGGTIPWGTRVAMRRFGSTPDIIYHDGDWGRSP